MSILIRHVFSRLGGLTTQERRPRILACDQTHGDPDASESNQEAVSHSNWLCPEKLWQVEHKPQGERNATPMGQRTGTPHRNRHQDGTNCQQQESQDEDDGSWPKTDAIYQAQERRAVLRMSPEVAADVRVYLLPTACRLGYQFFQLLLHQLCNRCNFRVWILGKLRGEAFIGDNRFACTILVHHQPQWRI